MAINEKTSIELINTLDYIKGFIQSGEATLVANKFVVDSSGEGRLFFSIELIG